MVEIETSPSTLVGRYVHTFIDDDGMQVIQQQGHIVAEPAPAVYLVEWFEWLIGDSTHQQLVPLHSMLDWHFYDDREWWNTVCATNHRRRAAHERRRDAALERTLTDQEQT